MAISCKSSLLVVLVLLIMGVVAMAAQTGKQSPPGNVRSGGAMPPAWMDASVAKMEKVLLAKHGDSQKERISRGLRQVTTFWRSSEGDARVFESLVEENFSGNQAALDALFTRFESLLEKLDGHLTEISRHFKTQTDLDLGPIEPYDEVFSEYDAGAHISDDFFKNKLAFVILLNFPLTTLEERIAQGERWSRRQWAEARLAQRFSKRIPAEVNLAIAEAAAQSDRYISEYNIWMHHLVDAEGKRLFPPKLKLLTHWNLRDEIKAAYSDKASGMAKQKTIQQVMERIITQSIPRAVINNPAFDWNPFSNAVKESPVRDFESGEAARHNLSEAAEPDTRYAMLLKTFQASRKMDPYSPTAPTLIARRFEENRELPEARVRSIFEQVLDSPLVPRIAALIEKRLGRPLQAFDIWYNGFRPRGQYTETELDAAVARKYPTAEAFKSDMPDLLIKLGFSPDRAHSIARLIAVDPARGSGHAMGASMRGIQARLRTRVGSGGMNYKGYNIAVHEMGHNVEQTISLNDVDHTLLQGVPNTAFTEAFAFVFQGRDLRLLGLAEPSAQDEALQVLNDYWGTYEIAGVALVDMAVWHWMYAHPGATPAELKAATLEIAREVWNRHFAPAFKIKDVALLAIYSHMISSFLYLPDYPLGHLIAFQIEEQMRKAGSVGPEFERMARSGNIAPDLWMKKATGTPVGAGALLSATERALREVEK